jgi:hypothetical protein
VAHKLLENGLTHGIDAYCVQIRIFNKEQEMVNFGVCLGNTVMAKHSREDF